MHNVLIISYIAFSIGNLFILPESVTHYGDVPLFQGRVVQFPAGVCPTTSTHSPFRSARTELSYIASQQTEGR